jgi:hypothetical protein
VKVASQRDADPEQQAADEPNRGEFQGENHPLQKEGPRISDD